MKKFIYGKDSDDNEFWCFNVNSIIDEIIDAEQVIFTNGPESFNVSCSCGCDDYIGIFTTIKSYDTSEELLNDLMDKIKDRIPEIDFDNIEKPQLSSVKKFKSIKLNDQGLKGKYIYCENDCYPLWIFNLKSINFATIIYYDCDATLSSCSNDDVEIERCYQLCTIDCSNVEVYDNPWELLETIKNYIKDQIERTSGLVI